MHRAGVTLFLLPRQRWILIPTVWLPDGLRPGLRLQVVGRSGRNWVLIPTANGLRPGLRPRQSGRNWVLIPTANGLRPGLRPRQSGRNYSLRNLVIVVITVRIVQLIHEDTCHSLKSTGSSFRLPTRSIFRLPNDQTNCVSSLKALLQLGPIPTANETASLRFASGCRKGMNCGQVDWKVIIGPLRRRRVVRTLDPVVGWSVNDDGGSFGKKRGRRTSGDE